MKITKELQEKKRVLEEKLFSELLASKGKYSAELRKELEDDLGLDKEKVKEAKSRKLKNIIPLINPNHKYYYWTTNIRGKEVTGKYINDLKEKCLLIDADNGYVYKNGECILSYKKSRNIFNILKTLIEDYGHPSKNRIHELIYPEEHPKKKKFNNRISGLKFKFNKFLKKHNLGELNLPGCEFSLIESIEFTLLRKKRGND